VKMVAFKYHEVTKARETGDGKDMAAKPNRVLGQGKRKVWVGAEVAANHKPKKIV
jgi:hypothetical protein